MDLNHFDLHIIIVDCIIKDNFVFQRIRRLCIIDCLIFKHFQNYALFVNVICIGWVRIVRRLFQEGLNALYSYVASSKSHYREVSCDSLHVPCTLKYITRATNNEKLI